MDIHNSRMRISLHSRVQVELVDQAGQSEPGEFRIVEAEKADLKSGLLGEDTQMARTLQSDIRRAKDCRTEWATWWKCTS